MRVVEDAGLAVHHHGRHSPRPRRHRGHAERRRLGVHQPISFRERRHHEEVRPRVQLVQSRAADRGALAHVPLDVHPLGELAVPRRAAAHHGELHRDALRLDAPADLDHQVAALALPVHPHPQHPAAHPRTRRDGTVHVLTRWQRVQVRAERHDGHAVQRQAKRLARRCRRPLRRVHREPHVLGGAAAHRLDVALGPRRQTLELGVVLRQRGRRRVVPADHRRTHAVQARCDHARHRHHRVDVARDRRARLVPERVERRAFHVGVIGAAEQAVPPPAQLHRRRPRVGERTDAHQGRPRTLERTRDVVVQPRPLQHVGRVVQRDEGELHTGRGRGRRETATAAKCWRPHG